MKSPVSLALLVLAAMLFAGCGSTPKSRIENDPAAIDAFLERRLP